MIRVLQDFASNMYCLKRFMPNTMASSSCRVVQYDLSAALKVVFCTQLLEVHHLDPDTGAKLHPPHENSHQHLAI